MLPGDDEGRAGLMRRRTFLGKALALSGLSVLPAAAQSLPVESYLVVDVTTKKILLAHNSGQRRPVASLTKIATACVTLDWAERAGVDLSQRAVVPPSAAQLAPNPFGFTPGDSISLRDALCCAMMGSDNIAAETLAWHVGADLLRRSGKGRTAFGAFVDQMNALAALLGMKNTKFLNPHGLDNAKVVPYSTAADMARLTLYAVKKPAFGFYVSQKQRKVQFYRGGAPQSFLLKNTNELVGSNGVDGVKTGTTSKAGQCLIVSARRKSHVIKTGPVSQQVFPRHIVAVLLAAQDRFRDARALLDMGWSRYESWAAAGRPINSSSELLDPTGTP